MGPRFPGPVDKAINYRLRSAQTNPATYAFWIGRVDGIGLLEIINKLLDGEFERNVCRLVLQSFHKMELILELKVVEPNSEHFLSTLRKN